MTWTLILPSYNLYLSPPLSLCPGRPLLECTKHAPASGPLHMLHLQPRRPPPSLYHPGLCQYCLLREAFPGLC